MTATKQQFEAYLNAARAIADAIKELGTAPLGPMYAAIMSKMSLNTFNGILDRLVGAKLITKTNETATWIGPN